MLQYFLEVWPQASGLTLLFLSLLLCQMRLISNPPVGTVADNHVVQWEQLLLHSCDFYCYDPVKQKKRWPERWWLLILSIPDGQAWRRAPDSAFPPSLQVAPHGRYHYLHSTGQKIKAQTAEGPCPKSPIQEDTELASDWSISFFKDCTVSTTSWNNIYNRGDPLVDHEMNLADGTTTEEQINFGIWNG